MLWLSENWIWLVFVFGVFLMMRQGGMGCGMSMRRGHAHHAPDQSSPPQESVDPVSGERVSAAGAVNTTYAGRIYYFASRANCEAFEADPLRRLPESAMPARHVRDVLMMG